MSEASRESLPNSLPAKLYFRIGEVASLVGVEPHVLRYWEREFRTIRPTKSARGQRVYSRRDVETLMRVRDLLYSDGFTIAGARKKLQSPIAKEAGAAQGVATTSSEVQAAAVVDTPAPSPTSAALSSDHRQALLDLKSEIETFLDELGT